MTNSEFLSSILPEMFHSHTETKTNSTNANHLACINFPSTGNKVTYYWVVTLFSKKISKQLRYISSTARCFPSTLLKSFKTASFNIQVINDFWKMNECRLFDITQVLGCVWRSLRNKDIIQSESFPFF